MKFLAFFTRTTRKIDFRAPANTQPDICSLEVCLWNEDNILGEINCCLTPQEPIDEQSIAYHGMTNEQTNLYGLSTSLVLPIFLQMAKMSDNLLTHDIDFHYTAISTALDRRGIDRACLIPKTKICMMKNAYTVKYRDAWKNKWPSIEELWQHACPDKFFQPTGARMVCSLYHYLKERIDSAEREESGTA